MTHVLLSLWLTLSGGAEAPALSGAVTLERFVLVIGANSGGADRARLRFAVSDAERFAGVMRELGGVPESNQVLLRQPQVQDLFRAFDTLAAKLEAAKRATSAATVRTEVVVYYSGHADEQGLLIGEDRVSYQSLREKLDEMPADVRIAVLDACASGAFTRIKGGKARPPFRIDASSAARGHAFLTSSAANESAQESDRLGASYFTHYLVSALRGAADLSGDGRVTLNEAYQFAFAETLGRTVGTTGGAQHPSYDIQLSGTGDVVMTDMRQTSSALLLGESIDGRLYVRNGARQLVAELQKAAGRTTELALEPGTYDLWLEKDRRAYALQVPLVRGARVPLEVQRFASTTPESTRRRGESEVPMFGVAGRTRVSMINGLWGSRGFVTVFGRRFDFFGGVQVAKHLNESFTLTGGVEAYGADADQDMIGGVAVPVALQWNPIASPTRRLKPFVTLGGMVVARSDAGQLRRLTSYGMQMGVGADYHVTRKVALTLKAAHNMVPAFGGTTWKSNYNGLQFSLGAGWTF